MKKIILFAFLIIGNLTVVYSQKPGVVVSDKDGWHKIGETTVDFKGFELFANFNFLTCTIFKISLK